MEIAEEPTDVLNEIQSMDHRVMALTHHVEQFLLLFHHLDIPKVLTLVFCL